MALSRRNYIEQIRRLIYGGMPSNDATITVPLVNQWLGQATAYAAKANSKDNLSIDGVNYINNSFYTRFTGRAITQDSSFVWKIILPEVPPGIGANEGISTLELVDPTSGQITRPFVPLSENQKSVYKSMRPIPNKILYYYEGNLLYAVSTLLLNNYTANVTMVSAGDSTNLDSVLNVPADYLPLMTDYLIKNLNFERNQPVDTQNDGLDAIKIT